MLVEFCSAHLFTWLHQVRLSMRALSLERMDSLAAVPKLRSHMDLVALRLGLWDLSSPTGDQTHVPVLQGEFLNTGPTGKSHQLLFELESVKNKQV